MQLVSYRFAKTFPLMETKRKKVLIADDEPDILEFISYNLKKEGYQVFTAASGKDAIPSIDARWIGLVEL